jgi:hypothetical protein
MKITLNIGLTPSVHATLPARPTADTITLNAVKWAQWFMPGPVLVEQRPQPAEDCLILSGTFNPPGTMARSHSANMHTLRTALGILARRTEQDCVACVVQVNPNLTAFGILEGPRAEAWQPFDMTKFVRPTGESL